MQVTSHWHIGHGSENGHPSVDHRDDFARRLRQLHDARGASLCRHTVDCVTKCHSPSRCSLLVIKACLKRDNCLLAINSRGGNKDSWLQRQSNNIKCLLGRRALKCSQSFCRRSAVQLQAMTAAESCQTIRQNTALVTPSSVTYRKYRPRI
jgi:hypothetical protein